MLYSVAVTSLCFTMGKNVYLTGRMFSSDTGPDDIGIVLTRMLAL